MKIKLAVKDLKQEYAGKASNWSWWIDSKVPSVARGNLSVNKVKDKLLKAGSSAWVSGRQIGLNEQSLIKNVYLAMADELVLVDQALLLNTTKDETIEGAKKVECYNFLSENEELVNSMVSCVDLSDYTDSQLSKAISDCVIASWDEWLNKETTLSRSEYISTTIQNLVFRMAGIENFDDIDHRPLSSRSAVIIDDNTTFEETICLFEDWIIRSAKSISKDKGEQEYIKEFMVASARRKWASLADSDLSITKKHLALMADMCNILRKYYLRGTESDRKARRDVAVTDFISSRQPWLWSIARSVTVDGYAHEDVVQELSLKAFEAWGKWMPGRTSATIETYVTRAMINYLREFGGRNKAQRFKLTHGVLSSLDYTNENSADGNSSAFHETAKPLYRDVFGSGRDPESVYCKDMVSEILSHLTPTQKNIVSAIWFNELKQSDVAKALNLSQGAISQSLKSAREVACAVLAKYGFDESTMTFINT